MAYYDQKKKSTLLVDASPVGLGAILSQPDADSSSNKVIAYASRALKAVEQRYSQTESKALAIIWACEHFHLYLYGSHFIVITDHKPLELIFNNPRASSPARLERWRLRLQQYTFTVQYKPGKDNPADYMSRHPVDGQHTDNCSGNAEQHINFIIDNTVPKAMTLDEVRHETMKDPVLQTVIKELKGKAWTHLKQTMPDACHAKLKAFHKLRHELTVNASQDIVLRGNRLILPTSLYQKAIQLAHVGHMGIVKTKQLIREKVWFPGIDAEVEKAVQGCIPCQAATLQHHSEPLNMSDLPIEPWSEVSVDFTGPFPSGDYLLVVVDDHSRYPEVQIVKSTAATAVIHKLDKIFSTFGIPKIVKTDNGPPFNSHCFADFSSHLGFKHRKITPYWPKANGEVERFMRTLKKTVMTSNAESKPWKQCLYSFLRNYRATPHGTTQKSPAELLFGRKINTTLPSNPQDTQKTDLSNTDHVAKQRMKRYADLRNRAKESSIKTGDVVLCRQLSTGMLSTPYEIKPYKVIKVKGSMVTASRSGRCITRNSSFFKRLPSHLSVEQNKLTDDEDDVRGQAPHSDVFQDNIPQSTRNTTAGPKHYDFSHNPRYDLRPNRRATRCLIEEM
uniref:Gypsy retrotransposon integrase-like protein 1 n=1 Tax=Esox lucius TaxID=8010 RepID=A0AAY5KA75_ESOLU